MVLHIERAKRSQNFLRRQLDTGGIGTRIVDDYLSGSYRYKDAAQLQVSTGATGQALPFGRVSAPVPQQRRHWPRRRLWDQARAEA